MGEYSKLLQDINLLKVEVLRINQNGTSIAEWIPRKQIMRFFDIGDTSMAKIEKYPEIEVSKIGRRKFYRKESILKLLENNKLKKHEKI